jgi:hypothetical protein
MIQLNWGLRRAYEKVSMIRLYWGFHAYRKVSMIQLNWGYGQ